MVSGADSYAAVAACRTLPAPSCSSTAAVAERAHGNEGDRTVVACRQPYGHSMVHAPVLQALPLSLSSQRAAVQPASKRRAPAMARTSSPESVGSGPKWAKVYIVTASAALKCAGSLSLWARAMSYAAAPTTCGSSDSMAATMPRSTTRRSNEPSAWQGQVPLPLRRPWRVARTPSSLAL